MPACVAWGHGAYLAWLKEARVEALGSAGLTYRNGSRTTARSSSLQSLRLEYRKPLLLVIS